MANFGNLAQQMFRIVHRIAQAAWTSPEFTLGPAIASSAE
jgi:hypothetical protein